MEYHWTKTACFQEGSIFTLLKIVSVRLIYTLRTRVLGKANFVVVLYYSFTLMGY